MSVASILLIIFALTSLFCIGLVVLAHNLTWLVRLSFSASILSLVIWYICLYVSNLNFSYTLFFNQIVYVGPIFAIVSFGLFLSAAFGPNHKISNLNRWSAIIAVPTVVLAATSLNVRAVKPRYDGGTITGFSIVPGHLGSVVTISLLFLVLLLIRHSYVIYRAVDRKNRKPLLLVLSTLALTLIVSSATNVVAPSLRHGSSAANAISNLCTLLFIGTMSYCVLRYRFLNIRLLVVRAIAYAAALVVLASVYGTIVFGLAKVVFHLHIGIWAQVYISAATALAALGFGSLRTFFDRVSSNLFYHDAYDAQELLDSLNRLFVATTELEPLLKESANIIESELKAEFCFFGIKGTGGSPQRVIGRDVRAIDEADIAKVQQITPRLHQKLVVTDNLTDANPVLLSLLEKYHISILGRLTPTTGSTSEGIGYLILGPRRSGNPYTRNDLRVIEIIVNELVIAIENSLRFEEIQNFNETLQANVSDATRKLRRTNEKLQALDATKDEFISMASHQLRTPLTSVKGYLSMVLEGDVGKLNAQQKQLLTQSYASAQRMVYLISDLLNLSRLSTGKFVIEPVATSLSEVVQSEIEQLQETAKSRDVTLEFKRPATFPSLMLDETKIHQVVMNFMDNAIYYTPPGGQVVVTLSETPTAVEFTVYDNGIGVPKAEQHKLFSKFYRAGNARKARPDGTGLGLFMAKKVIAASGGALVFESEEGKGSTFGFRFSKARHAVPAGSPATPPAELAKV